MPALHLPSEVSARWKSVLHLGVGFELWLYVYESTKALTSCLACSVTPVACCTACDTLLACRAKQLPSHRTNRKAIHGILLRHDMRNVTASCLENHLLS